MSAPVFVSFTDLISGSTIAVNVNDNISDVTPIPTSQLPTGVTDGSLICFDGRTQAVRGTVAATVSLLGQTLLGPVRLPNFPLGPVAYASIGTDAASTAGTLYFSEGFNPAQRTVSAVQVLNGTTVGTDNVIHFLYSAAGALLGTTALAGTLSAGSDVFQSINLLVAASLPAGRYYAGFQVNGTTAAHQTMAASSYPNSTGSLAGAFGTIPATITPPTTFTAGVGPFHILA